MNCLPQQVRLYPQDTNMTCSITWYPEANLLYLSLENLLTVQELQDAAYEIKNILDRCDVRTSVLIDVTKMSAGYHTADHIRDTQKYMNDNKLKTVFIVADTKLQRLITLMAFSVCGIPMIRFNSWKEAIPYLTQHGYESVVPGRCSAQR